MTSMSKSLTKLLLSVIVIASLLYLAIFGATLMGKTLPGAFDKQSGIKKGLDLSGGSVITYEAVAEDVTKDQINTVISMLRERLDKLGYTEATISAQGAKRVRIEIPDIANPEDAVSKIGATAKLVFVDSQNNVILDGTDVKDAKQQYGPLEQNGKSENFVSLTFTPEGATKFAEATGRVAAMPDGQNYIAIKLDEDVVSQPRVATRIDGDSCTISGSFTAESSKWLADIVRAGQLPFSLKDVELRSIGPTLGEKTLETSLFAGGLGVILVLLFMLLFYRLPGFIADIALMAYIALVLFVLSAFKVNLSLPGIAGIILSIGMAVDANVVIFERIKDEIRNGKTVGASIDAGFKRAFTAIFDSNITTLIAAVVLYFTGTGPVKGFAMTLGIGVILSMFTAIVITKFLLRQVVGLNLRNPVLYGVSAKGGNGNV